jgi:hypothetical protein
MKFILISLIVSNGWAVEFSTQSACQNAIREIYAQKVNPPGQRLKELETTINLQVKTSKEYLCVKKD